MGTPSAVVISGATGLVGTALAASCASDGMKIPRWCGIRRRPS